MRKSTLIIAAIVSLSLAACSKQAVVEKTVSAQPASPTAPVETGMGWLDNASNKPVPFPLIHAGAIASDTVVGSLNGSYDAMMASFESFSTSKPVESTAIGYDSITSASANEPTDNPYFGKSAQAPADSMTFQASKTSKLRQASPCFSKEAMDDWVQVYAFASLKKSSYLVSVAQVAKARNKACIYNNYADAVKLLGEMILKIQDLSDISTDYEETTAALYRLNIAFMQEGVDKGKISSTDFLD